MKNHPALLLALAALVAASSAHAQSADTSQGFSYDIPLIADAPEALRSQLVNDGEGESRRFFSERAEVLRDYPDNASAQNWQFAQSWSVAADVGNILSLTADIYEYSGGAHGNTRFASLLWDRQAGHQINLLSLFSDRYTALAHIDLAFCRLLASEQLRRMGPPDIEGGWDECPILHEQPIVATGGNGSINWFTVRLAPYVAGPYVAGPFEIAVPIDAALLAMIKPEYRESFAIAN